MAGLKENLFAREARLLAPEFMEMVLDGFAGAGGASEGIERALGTAVDVAINHNRRAVEVHQANHFATRHYCQDIYHVEPVSVAGGRRIGLAWFSPDCTHHSKARGGKPRSKKIRGLANRVLYWVTQLKPRNLHPRVIVLENVEEFQTWCRIDKRTGQPDKRRWGEYFLKFVRRLRQHGYAVEWNILNAADYGAGTARYRLFLIARCDGRPIVWPEPTHGPGRAKPYVTAAECIDWSEPTVSIFATQDECRAAGVLARRPLADSTLRRIAKGFVKYVLENKSPYIVRTGHYSNITGAGVGFRGQGVDKPLGTICSVNDKALIVPHLAKYHGDKGCEHRGQSVTVPLRTLDTQNRFGLVTAFLQKHYGCGIGQDAAGPLHTVTSKDTFSVVTAFLAKHYTGVDGQKMDKPLGTVTAIDHHSLVTAGLHPLPLGRAKEVAAYLVKFYGTTYGQPMGEPLHTITGGRKVGLVTVDIDGQNYVVTDIGMRMLTPRELLKAQFAEYADGYRMSGTKAQQIKGIGNSVPPHVAEAIVRANYKRRRSNEREWTHTGA